MTKKIIHGKSEIQKQLQNVRVMWAALARASKSEDHIAFFVFSNTVSEFWINQLLEQKCPGGIGKKIVVGKEYSHAIKLTIAYVTGLIPPFLFNNLKTLMKIRNAYAHRMSYCFWLDNNIENLTDPQGKLDFKALRRDFIGKKISEKDFLGCIRKVSEVWLSRHCLTVQMLSQPQ